MKLLIGSHIYWRDIGTGRIQRANLDGSNIEDLITGLYAPVLVALVPYYELTNPEETPTGSPEETRAALAERGIPYTRLFPCLRPKRRSGGCAIVCRGWDGCQPSKTRTRGSTPPL